MYTCWYPLVLNLEAGSFHCFTNFTIQQSLRELAHAEMSQPMTFSTQHSYFRVFTQLHIILEMICQERNGTVVHKQSPICFIDSTHFPFFTFCCCCIILQSASCQPTLITPPHTTCHHIHVSELELLIAKAAVNLNPGLTPSDGATLTIKHSLSVGLKFGCEEVAGLFSTKSSSCVWIEIISVRMDSNNERFHGGENVLKGTYYGDFHVYTCFWVSVRSCLYAYYMLLAVLEHLYSLSV